MRTLVLGGARSGKSAFAESLMPADIRVRYVATARLDPDDDEMAQRVRVHATRRHPSWTTVADADLTAVLREPPCPTIVDDIGAWLTTELDAAGAWDRPAGTIGARTDELITAIRAYPGHLVLVSPEAGLGVVPATASGRLFRDELGVLNQRLAAACDRVAFVLAGLPMFLKGSP